MSIGIQNRQVNNTHIEESLDNAYLQNEVGQTFDTRRYDSNTAASKETQREIDVLAGRVERLQNRPKKEKALLILYGLVLLIASIVSAALGAVAFYFCHFTTRVHSDARGFSPIVYGTPLALAGFSAYAAINKFKDAGESLQSVQEKLSQKQRTHNRFTSQINTDREALEQIKNRLLSKNSDYEQLANPAISAAANRAKQTNLEQLAIIDRLNILR